jgi:glutamate dehydrogenase
MVGPTRPLDHDALLEGIVDRVPGHEHRRPVLRQLAALAHRRTTLEHLRGTDPDAAATPLVDALGFLDGVRPGQMQVRVSNPAAALDGGPVPGSVVEVASEDRPFLVTTVQEELRRLGYRMVRSLHPVYGAARDPDGSLQAITPARGAGRRESFLQVILSSTVRDEDERPLVQALESVLAEVVAVTDDHERMRAAVAAVVDATRQTGGARFPARDVDEAAELLEWFLDGNFVLLGTCELDVDGTVRSAAGDPAGLGMLASRTVGARVGPPGPLSDELITVTRSPVQSSVARRVPIQRVDVLRVDPQGEVTGAFRLVGVGSRKADTEPAARIPLLRHKLERVLELEDVVPGSHDEAVLRSLFQVLPRDELFESSVEDLRGVLAELLAAEHEHEARVIIRPEPAMGMISVLVTLPRERYSQQLREQLERFCLSQLDGVRVDTSVSLGDRAEATISMVVYVEDASPPPDSLDSVAREIRLLCRTWEEDVTEALKGLVEPQSAELLAGEYVDRFPSSYRNIVNPVVAAEDVLDCHELCRSDAATRIRLRPGAPVARLKVFSKAAPIELSGFLPVLESLGLWVVDERSHRLEGHGTCLHVHDFGVRDRRGQAHLRGRLADVLAETALAMLRGEAEVDGLNELVLRAGLEWPDIAVLRAYERFRRQVGTVHTTQYIHEAFVSNPDVARALLALFEARFRPPGAQPEVVEELRTAVEAACDAVERLDHDRILRGFLGLVEATVRSNRYTHQPGGALAFKFDSAKVPGVPAPVPYREIFVHSPAVEGTHLRWGPVARGGIRWSDRLDDYRSETLGLVRAQVLKNAAIVPTGAKGAFVVKRQDAAQRQEELVQPAYEAFITGLLELTDNLADGAVVPAAAAAADTEDTYLVVAPDRGTARLSDVANALSSARGFWLGDAFASGGSTGYDHKRLGITARGAWVAARRHFHELDVDIQTEPVTVVGIGDMSGDVFGNGMLQSRVLRLVAAFDHRHIFIDPEPDPEAAWRERARLFDLPASTWRDYAPEALGPGGGVYDRDAKQVELSPEACRLLGLAAGRHTPAEVIRAILGAPVDLLYAGGIGTFIRGSDEPDRQIDDRANAEVRIDAASLRARVLVEGANLACTQRARIEYARRGGRCNTDAVDNGAGVALSDREVNLKLLLDAAIGRGRVAPAARTAELQAAESAVVTAVLSDAAWQTAALSRELESSTTDLEDLQRLLHGLEQSGIVDREVEALPSESEFERRRSAGAGLTRPELAVLLAAAKRALAADLARGSLIDEPLVLPVLHEYFPVALVERLRPVIEDHPLRREIIAARLASGTVDRMGVVFADRLARSTGRSPSEVALACWTATLVADAAQWWQLIEHYGDAGMMTLEATLAAALRGLVASLTSTYLSGFGFGPAQPLQTDRHAFAALEGGIATLGTPAQQARRMDRAAELTRLGLPPAEAARAACWPELDIVPYVTSIAGSTGRDALDVAHGLLLVTETAGLQRLLALTARLGRVDTWDRAAADGLAQDVRDLRDTTTLRALAGSPQASADEAVARFLDDRIGAVRDALVVVAAAEQAPAELGPVAVAYRAVATALRGGGA